MDPRADPEVRIIDKRDDRSPNRHREPTLHRSADAVLGKVGEYDIALDYISKIALDDALHIVALDAAIVVLIAHRVKDLSACVPNRDSRILAVLIGHVVPCQIYEHQELVHPFHVSAVMRDSMA